MQQELFLTDKCVNNQITVNSSGKYKYFLANNEL